MDSARYIIYGLLDPRTHEIRYVGKSTQGLKRPKEHFLPCNRYRKGSHVKNWIRSLADVGLVPEISILQQFETAKPLNDAEKSWIKHHRDLGAKLTNASDGGEAGFQGGHHTEEAKAKISSAFKGEKHPLFGRKHTAESLQKMSAWQKGRAKGPMKEETKAKLSALRQGALNMFGKKPHNFKGGKPKCLACGTQLANYYATYCRSHAQMNRYGSLVEVA